MKKLGKAKVIFSAFKDTFTGKLPRNEKQWPDWYKERYETCKECEFLTVNMSEEDLSELGWYKKLKVSKPQCSFCGCFVKQKAWMPTEYCAMGDEPGGIAKWNAMELITESQDNFNLINESYKDCNIILSPDGGRFVIDLGIVENLDENYKIILFSKENILINNITFPKEIGVDFKVFNNETSLFIRVTEHAEGEFEAIIKVDYTYNRDSNKNPMTVLLEVKGEVGYGS